MLNFQNKSMILFHILVFVEKYGNISCIYHYTKHSFASHTKRLKYILIFLKHSLSVSLAIWHRIYKQNKILIANRTTNLITFPLDLLFSLWIYYLLHKSKWKLLCWFAMDFWFLLFVSVLLRRGLCFARTTKTQEVMTSMEEKKGN